MYKRLPHFDLENHYQFITFRTKASVDEFVKKIQAQNIIKSKKEYLIDQYLDNKKEGAYFFKENIEILKNIILEKNNKLYEVEIFCIMPNHIHILLKQKSELKKIIKYIKGKSAVILNKKFNLKGAFWLKGYYDKIIRDEKHYTKVYEYIFNNPIKANLKDYKDRIYTKY